MNYCPKICKCHSHVWAVAAAMPTRLQTAKNPSGSLSLLARAFFLHAAASPRSLGLLIARASRRIRDGWCIASAPRGFEINRQCHEITRASSFISTWYVRSQRAGEQVNARMRPVGDSSSCIASYLRTLIRAEVKINFMKERKNFVFIKPDRWCGSSSFILTGNLLNMHKKSWFAWISSFCMLVFLLDYRNFC